MKKVNWRLNKRHSDVEFIEACETAKTMAEAATKLGLHFNSFKKRALPLGCYKPNQSGRGLAKIAPKIPLEEIIHEGLHPHYQSFKLKNRLIKEGIKKLECEVCGISSWRGKVLSLELHHKDGNRTNQHISNLELLCPNCHSQTETFRSKNRKI